jgi:hypothetical protein
VLPSGDSLVSIKESDPGHITGGHFFKRMADNGLEVDRWQIDNHKRIVIPGSDHNIIPQFIETLFQGYYGLEANCQIKAETLKL